MLNIEQEYLFKRCKEANSGFKDEIYTFKMGNPEGVFNLCMGLTLCNKAVCL